MEPSRLKKNICIYLFLCVILSDFKQLWEIWWQCFEGTVLFFIWWTPESDQNVAIKFTQFRVKSNDIHVTRQCYNSNSYPGSPCTQTTLYVWLLGSLFAAKQCNKTMVQRFVTANVYLQCGFFFFTAVWVYQLVILVCKEQNLLWMWLKPHT